MFRDNKKFTLTDVQTGEAITLTVRPFTMAMKANMDDWLRITYINKTLEDNPRGLEKAEKVAETLDCLTRNFVVSWDKLGPRFLYEMSNPDMTFYDFISRYFDVSIQDVKTADNRQTEGFKRFKENLDVVKQAVDYGCSNPTDTVAVEPSENPA